MVSRGSVESPSRHALTASATAFFVFLAVGCAAHTPGAAGDRSIGQVSVVPDFLSAWDVVRTAPRAEQLSRTHEALLAGHPELFGPEVFGTALSLDRDLERLLVEMPRLEPKLRVLSERMPGEVERITRRFLDEFPELGWSGPVASSLSFSQFEAVWRTVSGRRTLVLGLDAIAYYRGPYAPMEPVVHHALAAALLPAWAGQRPAPLWWTVWEAGFPLAAVRTIDPGVSDADLRLPEEGRDPAVVAALARRVRTALDSTREQDRRALLGGNGAGPAGVDVGEDGRRGIAPHYSLSPIQTGAGRWLALRVAQKVLAGRTLHDAARLTGPQLRSAVDAALVALERPGS